MTEKRIIVRVPTTLRTLSGGVSEVELDLEGGTVSEVLDALEAIHLGFKAKLLDETGAKRRSINLYLGEDDIRTLDGLDTPVSPGETIAIMPAVAGG